MYYKQNTKNIKMVILSFDDVLFELTKLRYNYFRRLCKLYNAPFDKQTFLNDQGSCRTMFSHSPIDPALLTQEAMIRKIEEDLLAYCKMYEMKHRDGTVEFMELLRQKKIPCILTSTHAQSFTEPLLKIAALYHRPTEVVYDAPDRPLLPDPAYYTSIIERYHLDPKEVLLIAANRQSVIAANQLRMNVIYLPGIEEPTKEMEIRCLKVINSLLDAINIVLEGSRVSPLSEQYLLIRHDGGTQDLYQNYQHLLDLYRNDPETLKYIEPIYQEEFSKAQKASVEAVLNQQHTTPEQDDNQSVLNALEQALSEENPVIGDIHKTLEFESKPFNEPVDKQETSSTEHVNPLQDLTDDENTFSLDQLASDSAEQTEKPENAALAEMIDSIEENKAPDIAEDPTRTRVFTKEELKMLGIKEKDLLEEDDEDEEDEEDEVKQPGLVTSFIVNIGYALFDAIVLSLFGGILRVGLDDWIADWELAKTLFSSLEKISNTLFHSLIAKVLIFFQTSESFISVMSVTLFLAIIIWILLDCVAIFRKKRNKIKS